MYVDVLQLLKTKLGKQYAVVFVDYLTKRPKFFVSQLIPLLLVEKIVS